MRTGLTPSTVQWCRCGRFRGRNLADSVAVRRRFRAGVGVFCQTLTIPAAFRAAKMAQAAPLESVERIARREIGRTLSHERTIPKMIDRIKDLFGDSSSQTPA